MHELARKKGVRFDDIPDDPHYSVPDELAAIRDRFVHENYALNESEEVVLNHRYIHFSAHWNNPFGKKTASGIRLIYFNAPNMGNVRRLHPHVAEWSFP